MREELFDPISDMLTEILEKSDGFYLPVVSNSMKPFINPGDEIKVYHSSPKNLSIGDIVLFWEKRGLLCVHRLLNVKQEGEHFVLVTKGDCLTYGDPPFSEKELLGRVVAIRKGQREIYLWRQRWKVINKLLGLISSLECCLFSLCRSLRQNLIYRYSSAYLGKASQPQ